MMGGVYHRSRRTKMTHAPSHNPRTSLCGLYYWDDGQDPKRAPKGEAPTCMHCRGVLRRAAKKAGVRQ